MVAGLYQIEEQTEREREGHSRPNAVRPHTGPRIPITEPRIPGPQALKFVIHFIGDLHQSLDIVDDGDEGGNSRYVTFRCYPDNLHSLWDTGPLQHIHRNSAAFTAELESRITPQDKAEWQKGSIEYWVTEGRRLAQTIAYGDLSNENPTLLTPAYGRQSESEIYSILRTNLSVAAQVRP
jgi:hypothetical protein